jgi:hypothetical protein
MVEIAQDRSDGSGLGPPRVYGRERRVGGRVNIS